MRQGLLLACLGVAVFAIGDPAAAQRRTFDDQPEAWVALAIKETTSDADRVVMPVPDGAAPTVIRVGVLDAPVHIRQIVLVFATGPPREFPIRRALAPGEMTDALDLAAIGRPVREIAIEYGRTVVPGRIALLGERDEASQPKPARAKSDGESEPGLSRIAFKSADTDAERDSVPVGREKGRLDRIVLAVAGADLPVRTIRVVYATGEPHLFTVDAVIPAGRKTSDIVVDGDRFIDRVELIYGVRGASSRKATIEILGAASADPGGRTVDRADAGGWTLIGLEGVGIAERETTLFEVRSDHGTVAKLRLAAKQGPVEVRHVVAVYQNGHRETVPVNRTIKPGEIAPMIDVPGLGRYLTAVGVAYKARAGRRGDGVVEIWGRK